jgi:hypothetical protein
MPLSPGDTLGPFFTLPALISLNAENRVAARSVL